MIDKNNLENVLISLDFKKQQQDVYTYEVEGSQLKVDFNNRKLCYPSSLKIHNNSVCNFAQMENFVVFECVYRLLKCGYKLENIELEPRWQLGHKKKGGRADILIKDNAKNSFLIIECKTWGDEFEKAWEKTEQNGGQLFSYVQQEKSTQWICLYTSGYSNKKVCQKYRVIKVKNFNEESNVEKMHKIWADRYEKDFVEGGIFEDGNIAYKILEPQKKVKDLKDIEDKDIQSKYHKFATILRQYNISGRENAFDKLVNLFLCKIVDEKSSQEGLKFYWHGYTYDDCFLLQDRLQKLYQEGMRKFLGEDVTYVDEAEIEEVFKFCKKDPDATKEEIKRRFRELKFFTNNDFAFIDVHNEKLFFQNIKVLIEVVKMLHEIRLESNNGNQFLGDMFEGFLDQGVKQSEGQFFTPMPIVKFMLLCLPLRELISKKDYIPKVLDYACGAGHFLNEYALQIRPYVEESYGKDKLKEYYKKITGIEKEYRLSKISKVSAFMYGQDEIQIIYGDALSENEKVQDGSFDLLVTNPPYSVKGFLQTLSDKDKEKFDLNKTIDVSSRATNNSIEAFFIERAEHLLKKGGIVAIILPASILTKGSHRVGTTKRNVYVRTREILLENFNIIAISEFASGTFGKTGTNTVVLFLRKKEGDVLEKEHYMNRVNLWFDGELECPSNKVYEDTYLIEKYCTHLGFNTDSYKKMLVENVIDERLLATDEFTEYRKSSKDKLKNGEFVEYCKEIERDKLYYFILAYMNSKHIVISKMPTTNAEAKKFLGYEWSNAKGNEGIKYIGTTEKPANNKELDEGEKRTLENLSKLRNINTPLYDPENYNNPNKINTVIAKNFKEESCDVPENLKEFVTKAKLIDMLDFTRAEFNKAISLNPKQSEEDAGYKYPMVKLGDVAEDIISGATPSKEEGIYWNKKEIRWATIEDFFDLYIIKTRQYITKAALTKVRLVPINSVLLSCTATIGKVAINKVELTTNQQINAIVCNNTIIINEYLAYYLESNASYLRNSAANIGVKHINLQVLRSFKIPLPPKNIQEKVVAECGKVDQDRNNAQTKIAALKKDIKQIMIDVQNQEHPMVKLGDVAEIVIGGTPPRTTSNYFTGNNLWVSVSEMKGQIINETKEKITDEAVSNSNVKLIPKGTTLLSFKLSIGKTALAGQDLYTNEAIAGLIPKKKDVVLNKWFFCFFTAIRLDSKNAGFNTFGQSLNTKALKLLQIPLPPKNIQEEIVKEIQVIENNISLFQEIISSAATLKAKILDRYLK